MIHFIIKNKSLGFFRAHQFDSATHWFRVVDSDVITTPASERPSPSVRWPRLHRSTPVAMRLRRR